MENAVINNLDHENFQKIRSRYDDLMKIILYNDINKTNKLAVEVIIDQDIPLISVIVATKNRAMLLKEAMISIFSQSYSNIEVIIVDDGSTDQTRYVVEEFICRYNVKYVHATCNRSTSARNIGLRHAVGKYIAYLDDDNLWFPTFVSSAISYFERNENVDLIYGILVFDNASENKDLYIFQKYDKNTLRMSNYIDTNVIIHRSTLLPVDCPWDENLTRLGDWDFVLSYTSHHNTAAISVLATYYRTHAENRNTVIYSLEENARYIKNKHQIL